MWYRGDLGVNRKYENRGPGALESYSALRSPLKKSLTGARLKSGAAAFEKNLGKPRIRASLALYEFKDAKLAIFQENADERRHV